MTRKVIFIESYSLCKNNPTRVAQPFADLPPWWSSILGRGLCSVFIWLDVWHRRFWVCLLRKPLGNWQGIDVEALPPGQLIARLMQLAMMTAAERYGELIADFETERSGLGKAQVMRIGRLPAAHETGLRGHESQMGFVTQPFGLSYGQNAFIDLSREEVG